MATNGELTHRRVATSTTATISPLTQSTNGNGHTSYTNGHDHTNGSGYHNGNGDGNGSHKNGSNGHHHTNGHSHTTATHANNNGNGHTKYGNGSHHDDGGDDNNKTLAPHQRPGIRWQTVVRLAFSIPMIVCAFWLLSMSDDDARQAVTLFDSKLGKKIEEKSYDDACGWNDMVDKVWDPFVIAHLFGWMANAMVARTAKLTIFMSLIDEFCELWWRSSYNNFKECWWDHIFLDLIICNSGGAIIGALIMKQFKQSRNYMTEFGNDPYKRRWLYFINLLAIKVVCMFMLFGFKEVLWVPPAHIINYYRCFAYCALLEGAISDGWNAVKYRVRGIRAHSQLLLMWFCMLLDLTLVCKMGYHVPVWANMNDIGRMVFGMGTITALYSFTVLL